MNSFFHLSQIYTEMLWRFVICMVTIWIIVDRLYFRKSHRRDFYFTFMLIAVAIFFLVFFMIFILEDLKAKTSIGIGIGLFGIFSIMRYRTDSMPVREMTYLFSIISLSVVNAIADTHALLELILTNAIFIFAIWLCERMLRQEPYKLVQYDRISLIVPERRDELIADLKERLGLNVTHVEIGGSDLLRYMTVIKVYYRTDGNDEALDKKTKLNATEMVEG
jgi:hypothetical protein